jgi:hypothetical protein
MVDTRALAHRRHSDACGGAGARGCRFDVDMRWRRIMKRSTYWMVFLLAIAPLWVPRNCAAQTDRAAADKTLSPYFLVAGGDPDIDRLPL